MKHTPYIANLSTGNDTPHWQPKGACAAVDPRIFFPEVGKPGNEARLICAGCPVRAACLAWAIAHPAMTETGIYGGTSDRERRRIRTGKAPLPEVPEPNRKLLRTHCKWDHELTGDNLYIDSKGYHRCQKCRRASWNRHVRKESAA
jgi:hypothetical protein